VTPTGISLSPSWNTDDWLILTQDLFVLLTCMHVQVIFVLRIITDSTLPVPNLCANGISYHSVSNPFPSVVPAVTHYDAHSASCFAAFLLLGFLEIGQEMYVHTTLNLLMLDFSDHPTRSFSENPFNYDENDLGPFLLYFTSFRSYKSILSQTWILSASLSSESCTKSLRFVPH
jgi:hypothetical protein